MNLAEFRKLVEGMSDQQLEKLLLQISSQGADRSAEKPAESKKPEQKAEPILPQDVLDEMEEVRKRKKNLDAEHAKWLRSCDRLLELPMKEVPLRGASDLEVYQGLKGLCQEKHLPWEFGKAILGQVMSYLETGSMKPMLLVGEPGCGKTTAAQYMAETMGLPHFKVSAPKASTSHGLSGETRSYRGGDCGEIVRVMLTTGVRNPVLIIDEIDKVTRAQHSAALDDELLSVCDGTHDIFDNFIGCRFDLGQCPVVLTANDLRNVSGPLLDRCQVVRFPEADLDRLNKIMERYVDCKLPAYHGRVRVEESERQALTAALFRKDVKSIRQYQKLMDKTLDEAYFKALEGESGIVNAEAYLWIVEEFAASKKRTVGF